MSLAESVDFGTPHLPDCPSISIDGFSLARIRDELTRLPPYEETGHAVASIVARWNKDPESIDPIYEIGAVMESIRALPRGDVRVGAMNTYVRALGEPQVLATLLDMMRASALRPGSRGEELTRMSRNAARHCAYGWAGQTLLVASDEKLTNGTLEPEPGVRELIGGCPPSVWGLSLHVWQPNPNAKGFPSGARIGPDIVVEPPHSHPFEYSSMVATGTLRQSIYAQRALRSAPGGLGAGADGGAAARRRYDGVRLEHVDGVWPEHTYQASCELETVEEGVDLRPGESYYLPCDMIHDVEFETKAARSTPTITLFLASEIIVKPHVYIAPAMADAHAARPGLKDEWEALSSSAWHAKLEAVAAYLRGDRPTLLLDDIVKCDAEYAFFHA